jgi:hypothetical protein
MTMKAGVAGLEIVVVSHVVSFPRSHLRPATASSTSVTATTTTATTATAAAAD